MSNVPTNKQSDDDLRVTAENIVASLLSLGPKIYGLTIDMKTFQELVWEAWSEKYVSHVRSQLSKLPNNVLEAMEDVVAEMIDKKENQKPIIKRKSNLN